MQQGQFMFCFFYSLKVSYVLIMFYIMFFVMFYLSITVKMEKENLI